MAILTTAKPFLERAQSAPAPFKSESVETLYLAKDFPRAIFLKTNYFDPSVWRERIQSDGRNYHDALIREKITPGHFWVQKGLTGSIIHWSEKKEGFFEQPIHRASFFQGKILIVSYSLDQNGAPIALKTPSITMDVFKGVLHHYLQNEKWIQPLNPIVESQRKKPYGENSP